MTTDNVADMFTRIRNAHMKYKKDVMVLCSKHNLSIANLLLSEGYIKSIDHKDKDYFMRIELKYYRNEPVIEHIKRISSPGKRVYVRANDLPIVRSNLGLAIISTSSGLMTNIKARKLNVGGEIIGEVY